VFFSAFSLYYVLYLFLKREVSNIKENRTSAFECLSCTVEIVYNEHQDQAEFARYNRYRYNHIRAPTRPHFSTKSTRYIRLLVITGLVIYDFYCMSAFGALSFRKVFMCKEADHNVFFNGGNSSLPDKTVLSVQTCASCHATRRRSMRPEHSCAEQNLSDV